MISQVWPLSVNYNALFSQVRAVYRRPTCSGIREDVLSTLRFPSCFKVADGCAVVAMPLIRLMSGHIRRPTRRRRLSSLVRSAGCHVN